MPSQNPMPRAAPKISSSSAFSNSAKTSKQLTRSALLQNAFAPSSLQLNLFASVVQGLNAQVLRIHDTLTGRHYGEHSLEKGRISCLDWGYYGKASNNDRPTKKRKTKGGSTEVDQDRGDAVVALGTFNSPDIELYCPAKAKVISILKGGHNQGIKDFKFVRHTRAHNAWSLGDDGKLVEWNMGEGIIIRSVSLPSQISPPNILLPTQSHILCAFSSIYGIDPEVPAEFSTFSGFSGTVHSLFVQSNKKDPLRLEAVIGAAESERNIVVFDFEGRSIKGQMIASSAVERVIMPVPSSRSQYDVLAAITDRGEVELFERPFDFHDTNSEPTRSSKVARQAMTRRPRATVRITRPGKAVGQVVITSAEFEDDMLLLNWTEGGAHPCFERIAWRGSDGSIALSGDVNIEKAERQDVVANAKMNGLNVGSNSVDDAQTVVAKGADMVGLDGMEVDTPSAADSSSAEDGSSDDEDDQETTLSISQAAHLTNGTAVSGNDDHMSEGANFDPGNHQTEKIAPGEEEEEGEDEERGGAADGPSFGELLRAKAPEPVDVSAAFPAKAQTALVPRGERSMDLPPGMSLAMVLAQSLRTNDRDLLETCFHVQDLQVVRTTIERLDSALAGSLLEKLAERLHNRPGRAGSLMVWIQWTLVAHGGYLAGQGRIVKQLRQLHSVVRERAQALQPLLLLKGKLDMLEAQMQLRRRAMERSRVLQSAQEDEEEDAIYVEGQEEDDSEDDDMGTTARPRSEAAEVDQEDIEFDSEDGEDDLVAAAMDVDQDEDEDEDEDEDNSEASENDLIDDEAEETSEDSGIDDDEDAIDYDDVDSLDEESELDNHPVYKAKGKAKVNGIVKKIR